MSTETTTADFTIRYGKPDQLSIYDADSMDRLDVFPTNLVIEKRLNELSTMDMDVYITDSDVRSILSEGNDLLFFNDNESLIFKGEITDTNINSQYEAEVQGKGMGKKLMNYKTDRTEYDEVAGDTIITNYITSSVMTQGTIESAPKVSVRFDHDNYLRAQAGVANALGYDWYIDQDPSDFTDDRYNFVGRKGSATSVKTYTLGDNAELTKNGTDDDHVANDITILGRGDGINQLEARVFAATSRKTVTTQKLDAGDTSSLNVSDTSDFGNSGDSVTIRVGSEVIGATISDSTTFNIGARGQNNYQSNSTPDATHFDGVQVFLVENTTQGIGPFSPNNPESGTSMADEYVADRATDKGLIKRAAVEKIADNELKDRYAPINRVQIRPSDPRESDISLGDDVTIDAVSGSNLSGDYRVVGIDYHFGTKGEYTIIHCANRPLRLVERLRDFERNDDTINAHMQGATNFNSEKFEDNCDSSHSLSNKIYVPDDVVDINKFELTFTREGFRGYIQNTNHSHSVTVNHPSHTHDVSDTSTSSNTGEYLSKSMTIYRNDYTETGTSSKHVEVPSSPTGTYKGANIAIEIYNGTASTETYDWELEQEADTANLDSGSVTLNTYEGITINKSFSSSELVAGDQVNFTMTGEKGSDAGAYLGYIALTISAKSSHDHDISDTSSSALGSTTAETADSSGSPSYGIYEPDTESDVDVDVKVDGNTVTTVSNVSVGQEITSNIDLIPDISEPIAGSYHTIELVPTGLCRLSANVLQKVFIESTL